MRRNTPAQEPRREVRDGDRSIDGVLLQLAKDLTGSQQLDELLQKLSHRLREVAEFDNLGLMLHHEQGNVLRIALVEPTTLEPRFSEVPVEGSSTGDVWRSQHSVVAHLTATASLRWNEVWLRDRGFRVVCAVPLTTPRRRLGVLAFASRAVDDYPADAVRLFERIAAQVALEVEHILNVERLAAMSATLAAERDRLNLLLGIANAVASELELQGLMQAISRVLAETVRHHFVSLTLHDPSTGQFVRHALIFPSGRGDIQLGPMRPDPSPATIAFERGTPMVFRQEDTDRMGSETARIMRAEGLQAACCIPLATARGKYGTLNVGSPDPDAFTSAEVELLTQVSLQLAIAVENALAYQDISRAKDKLAGEKQYLEEYIRLEHDFTEIIGESVALRRVLQAVETVARTDATVLLLGETGTGKELLARAVHNLSRRRGRSFVTLNGAALPANLVESELFGYEKGAFTGAASTKMGRLELADQGTLFLDEIGDIPLEVQPKLLRALQDRSFERLGGTRTHRVDVRLIAATNRQLAEMVAQGAFRSDLFYRLNVFPIEVPSLRDRRDDIPLLAWHFVRKFAHEMDRQISAIPEAAMQALQQWDWPGNIRELENVIERAVILSRGSVLQVPLGALQRGTLPQPVADRASTLRDVERDAILKALRESAGAVAGDYGAAARLGLKRTTLQSKMRKLGIRRPAY